MKTNSFREGCRSGVQYAIRYGDLNLLKTCLDFLLNSKEDSLWLWRKLPIIVAAEVWYMLGETACFLEKVCPFDCDATEMGDAKKLRSFLFRLAALPNAQDALLLLKAVALVPEMDEEHPELSAFRFWFEAAQEDLNIVAIDFCAMVTKKEFFGPMSDDESKAIIMLRDRLQGEGILTERLLCLSAMFLIALRKMPESFIRTFVKYEIDNFKKGFAEKQVRTVNLPWWVFDPNTTIGSVAGPRCATFCESYGIDVDKFGIMWSLMSFVKAPGSIKNLAKCEKPSCIESIWLPFLIRELFPIEKKGAFKKMDAKAVKNLWQMKIVGVLEKCISDLR